MFGIRFIKVQPTTYLLEYRGGKLKREGKGLAFFYFAPTTSLVAIPLESVDEPFIFNQVTADFQEVSIQGQVTYRIAQPLQISQLLNFTLDNRGVNYTSLDHEKLPQRVVNVIQVLMQSALAHLALREALTAANTIVQEILQGLQKSKEINSLGLEILGLSILAISPTPETSRALEADIREQLLREADEAIYTRRNAAVEQERAIKENELNTEIAVENKKRQIRETKIEADRAVQQKKQQMREEQMAGDIALEKQNKELVMLATDNTKQEAEAKAYSLAITLQALSKVDVKVLQALASVGMNPSQLIALAFRDLAEGAEKIGQLNISPDLLHTLLHNHSLTTELSKELDVDLK